MDDVELAARAGNALMATKMSEIKCLFMPKHATKFPDVSLS